MNLPTMTVSMTVNGKATGEVKVSETLLMIDFLREYLNLTGTRLGCGQGVCRACVIILDREDGQSEEIRTCITGVGYFNGRRVRTIEGQAKRNEQGALVELTRLQQTFLDFYSFQCGYCTPGFVNAATVMLERLERSPIAREDVEDYVTDSLSAHICRCTGYVRYYEAVKDVILKTPGLIREKQS